MNVLTKLLTVRDAIAPSPADMAGDVFGELWPYCLAVVVVAVAVILIVRGVKKKKRAESEEKADK